jgi:hypothetical protein
MANLDTMSALLESDLTPSKRRELAEHAAEERQAVGLSIPNTAHRPADICGGGGRGRDQQAS